MNNNAMPIVKWEPFRDLLSLQERMNRLFEESLGRQENYHRIERSYGVFNRSFALPATVEADNIKARFSNGILEIIVPKQEEARPKQIKVDIE